MNQQQIEELKRECIPSDLSLEELHELCDLAIQGLGPHIPAAPEGYRHELVRLSTSTDAAPQMPVSARNGTEDISSGSPSAAAAPGD